MSSEDAPTKIGPASMSALVAGGMVGGGIYVALGVVVEAAGRWAWLSFVISGIVAVSTASAYAALSNHFETGGGAFAFLEKVDRRGMAGSLSWVLIVAYTLTLALYSFAFGQYVANALGAGPWVTRGLSLAIMIGLTALNLAGVSKLTKVEIVIVSANLVALLALGAAGVADFRPGALVAPDGPQSPWAAIVGAAAIFVSYEGFQLLTYEYDEIESPKSTLQPVMVWSSVAVVAVYVIVAIGATSIIGAENAIEQPSIALATAGGQLLGVPGLVAITVAAAFATAAAINSTLFSTAQLAARVSDDGELPAWFDHRNGENVPDRAVLLIATIAAILSVVGSLGSLVEAASLVFLVAFAVVDVLAIRRGIGSRWLIGAGAVIGVVVGAVLVWRLATTKPLALTAVVTLMVASFLLRPWVLRHVPTDDGARLSRRRSG